MKFIPLVVLFFLSVPILVSSQSRDVITMPSLGEVSEITIVDNTPRYFSAESLLKLLPCFTPNPFESSNSDTQQGLIKLKSGQTMRWVAENHESIIIFTDKEERSFRLSSGCSTVTQSVGKHKGLLKKAQNHGNLVVKANFELVLEKFASNPNFYHATVYVTDLDGRLINLSQSGYAGILLNSNGKQITIKLSKASAGCAADAGCFRSAEKFGAVSDLQVEVISAFPSKGGSGIAIFEPFKDSSKE